MAVAEIKLTLKCSRMSCGCAVKGRWARKNFQSSFNGFKAVSGREARAPLDMLTKFQRSYNTNDFKQKKKRRRMQKTIKSKCSLRYKQ